MSKFLRSNPSTWDTVEVLASTGDPEPVAVISRDEARALKKAGTHYFVNHGKAMREVTLVADRAQKDLRNSACGLEDWQRVHFSLLSPAEAIEAGFKFLRITTQQIIIHEAH